MVIIPKTILFSASKIQVMEECRILKSEPHVDFDLEFYGSLRSCYFMHDEGAHGILCLEVWANPRIGSLARKVMPWQES
jgi:hypothetical protein